MAYEREQININLTDLPQPQSSFVSEAYAL